MVCPITVMPTTIRKPIRICASASFCSCTSSRRKYCSGVSLSGCLPANQRKRKKPSTPMNTSVSKPPPTAHRISASRPEEELNPLEVKISKSPLSTPAISLKIIPMAAFCFVSPKKSARTCPRWLNWCWYCFRDRCCRSLRCPARQCKCRF